MPDLKQQIHEYVTRTGYKPLTAKSLAKKLGIRKKSLPAFQIAIEQLISQGRLHEGKSGLLKPRQSAELIAGIIKRTSAGAGFLIPHDQPPGRRVHDVYISSRDVRDAHTGDEVLVRLLKRRRQAGQRCGIVEEVIERATRVFVGAYFESDDCGYVLADGNTFRDPIFVGDPGAKGAQPDDMVVIEMLRFPSHYQAGEAVVTKVLGARGEPGVDEQTIIHELGLPDEFPEKVLEEARRQAEQFDERELGERLDLTRETIITIDPADARDFDDAISLTRSPDGHWHLGVHIADVSHFIQPESALDEEARKRGTSVYLPGRVLPMLPEVISNGLASLQQRRMRFTKSALIEFTAEGIPIHTELVNSAIKVSRRFAYEEVLPIIQDPERYKAKVGAKIRALLARMHELAMVLRARRFAQGALELNLPEVKLDLDKDGRVTGAHEVQHDESHQIIEEFMLAANVAVATTLFDAKTSFLRRVHPDPDLTKLQTFAEFVTALGYRFKRVQSRPDMQILLEKVKGARAEYAVNYALLRSLKQAEYTGLELGHYALAEEHYCHFTSPIRRYPDLTIHRLIDARIRTTRRVKGPAEVELVKLGKHCSVTERRAAQAERELTKVKLLNFLAEQIGRELDAVVTGVDHYGFFCRGLEIPVEGLVHVSNLEEDHYYFDQPSLSLIGRRSGRQYRLGDEVRVRVAHVDVNRRELDFRVVPQRPKSGRRKSKSSTSSITKKKPAGSRTEQRGSRKKKKRSSRT